MWLAFYPNQVEGEGRSPVTQFDQLALPPHVPVAPRPARDSQGFRGRRAVEELRREFPTRQGERQRAVRLGASHVKEHTRAPVVPDLGAPIGGEHQVMKEHLVSLTGPWGT